MVTKLRSFSTSTTTKIIAIILFVISITTGMAEMQYIKYQNISYECIFVKEYKDSEDFYLNYVCNALSSTLYNEINGGEAPQNTAYYYYYTDGETKRSNTTNTDRSFFEQFDKAFYAFEKGAWSGGRNTNIKPSLNGYGTADSKYTAYIAFSNLFMDARQKEWQNSRNKLIPIAITLAICIVLAFLLLIFLISVTGRKPQDKELHLSKLDGVYSDILFFSLISITLIWLAIETDIYRQTVYFTGKLDIYEIRSMVIMGILTVAAATISIVIFLALVRKIKAGKLLKHSLIFIAFYKIYDLFKSIFDGRVFAKYPLTKSLFYRQLVFIIASAALVFLTFVSIMVPSPLILFSPALEILIIYWYIKGNNKTFTDINKGFNESLEEQMRAERMKIALVTNVSHDLKTPLTSIISYVDLLSKEEELSEVARDYVKIISEKSNRLKNIVADLFDLAKSTSGDISLDFQSLDIKKLIQQTLADMTDEVEKSGLQIKIKLPDNPVNIISDGKKLYRVFQNVLCNALKYSLKGTRVFVELEEINGKAIATIKNTAGYEMDFTADEILQRFNRGDKSRTTEGSGLGLSIAESFTNVCGGSFKVNVDGDLFKVTIAFNISL